MAPSSRAASPRAPGPFDNCNLLAAGLDAVVGLTAQGTETYPDGSKGCHREYPYRPDVKLSGSYTLPFDILIAGTYQFSRGVQTGGAGPSIQALWPVLNAVANPQIGRNWTGTASRTIQLIREGLDFGDDNLSQLDLRASQALSSSAATACAWTSTSTTCSTAAGRSPSARHTRRAADVRVAASDQRAAEPLLQARSAAFVLTLANSQRPSGWALGVGSLGSPMAIMRESLVERATALVPMLRRHAASAEKARRVPQDSFDALSAAGIFTMTAPKAYGGVEADFQTQCDVLAEIARGCPSTSWVATIYSAMSWLVATFPDQAQEEIFATRDPRVSGVFSPTGTAVAKDGGFVVNGRWGYNTGCHGANWTVLNVLVGEMPTCMIARSADLKILDDWYATGMSATGSNTVVAENVFVPAYRTQPLPAMLDARYPDRHTAGNPYFNYPLAAVLTVNAGGTPVGTARGAMDAFLERLPGRGITYTNYTNKAEAPVTHLQLAEASLKLDSSDAHVRLATALLDRSRRVDDDADAREGAGAHRLRDRPGARGDRHPLLRERRLLHPGAHVDSALSARHPGPLQSRHHASADESGVVRPILCGRSRTFLPDHAQFRTEAITLQ